MSEWRDHFRVHPAAEWYPMMKDDELDAMAEDVADHGLRHRVVYHLLDDDSVEILDGRNRLEALERAGLPLFCGNALNPAYFEKAGKKALEDVTAYIESANLHRRHLSGDEKRDAITRLLQLDPTRSDRAIGRMVGADGKTVASVRRHEEDVRNIPHVATRTDSLQRQQPARKKPAEEPHRKAAPITSMPQETTERWNKQAEDVTGQKPTTNEDLAEPTRKVKAENHRYEVRQATRRLVEEIRAAAQDEMALGDLRMDAPDRRVLAQFLDALNEAAPPKGRVDSTEVRGVSTAVLRAELHRRGALPAPDEATVAFRDLRARLEPFMADIAAERKKPVGMVSYNVLLQAGGEMERILREIDPAYEAPPATKSDFHEIAAQAAKRDRQARKAAAAKENPPQ